MAAHDHDATVKAIADRVRHFHTLQRPFRVYHGSTNSTRHSTRNAENTVDTSHLSHVLSVSTSSRTVVTEPNVPMDALLAATTAHGLVPLVVMEFPGITAGGGFSGTSGESSSFRHGVFENTVNWIEIVLGDGTVTRASRDEQPDLFWGAASGFGTLGVVTLLEVRLEETGGFVEVVYSPCRGMREAVEKTRLEIRREENDYVDGIVYAPDSVVICSARRVDSVPDGVRIQRFSRARDPWFYVHAQKIRDQLQRSETKELSSPGESPAATMTDYVPLRDYLFRYDRGGFWGARYSFSYFLTPFNRVTRFLLDPFLRTRVLYRAMHQSGLSDFYMVQDVGVPYASAEQFHDWLREKYNIYPLWICPLLVSRDAPDSNHGLHAAFGRPPQLTPPNSVDDATPPPPVQEMLNFGIWGPLSNKRREAISGNRALEAEVARIGGKKWLYGQAFYTKDEFWSIYDRPAFDALREKYGAQYLPSVFDKVNVDVEADEARRRATMGARIRESLGGVWPLRGLYGVWSAVRGKEYLMRKKTSSVEGAKESQ